MPRPKKTKRRAEHDKSIGRRLAELRRARGLTQVEVAEQLGIAQSLYSHYECGRAGLDSRLVMELARILKASTDELLGVKPVKTDAAGVQRTFLRRLQKLERLPRRDQQALLRTIDAFLSKAG